MGQGKNPAKLRRQPLTRCKQRDADSRRCCPKEPSANREGPETTVIKGRTHSRAVGHQSRKSVACFLTQWPDTAYLQHKCGITSPDANHHAFIRKCEPTSLWRRIDRDEQVVSFKKLKSVLIFVMRCFG